jgi:GNAT superfamily N-acetyltransferase
MPPPSDEAILFAAVTPDALAQARALFQEYVAFLGENLGHERYSDDAYVLVLLAHVGGEPAAAAGLRRLDAETCEMKRLYCRPAFRGRGLGRAMCARLFAEARALGFERMRLDTLERLAEAVALYKALGFRRIPAYNDNPLAGVMHMERAL